MNTDFIAYCYGLLIGVVWGKINRHSVHGYYCLFRENLTACLPLTSEAGYFLVIEVPWPSDDFFTSQIWPLVVWDTF